MNYRIGLMLLVASVATAQGNDKTELAYLRAWYVLNVDEEPAVAERLFLALRKNDALSKERAAMCEIGIAKCRLALRNHDGARAIYTALLPKLEPDSALHKRVTEALADMGKGAHDGEFKFHYKQGFDFKTGKVVDQPEGDVVFARCAGGIASITLEAASGATTLHKLIGYHRDGMSPALQWLQFKKGFASNEKRKPKRAGNTKPMMKTLFQIIYLTSL